MAKAGSTEKVVREIRRHTRRRFSAEEKIRIVLEGLRGEESIAARCRREGLNPNIYYRWSKSIKSFTDVQCRPSPTANRFLPHGLAGAGHQAVPGQLVALRSVHVDLED